MVSTQQKFFLPIRLSSTRHCSRTASTIGAWELVWDSLSLSAVQIYWTLLAPIPWTSQVHTWLREYVTPSRDLHVPGSTLTGNDLPIKKLPRAFHPLPIRTAWMQGEELYLELNSQLGEQRQMSLSTTPCIKSISVSQSQSFRYCTSTWTNSVRNSGKLCVTLIRRTYTGRWRNGETSTDT